MEENKSKKNTNVPPLRFPGFTDEWKNNKVGNLFEISVAGDIDKSSISHNQSRKYPYPIISNSLENEGIYGYTNKYKCEAGTITVTGRGTLGIAKSRDYRYYPIVRLLSLKPCDSIDYRFAQYALNLIHYFFEVTGVPQLTAPQLSSYDIRYPTLSEQQKIARFLSLIDDRIATQNKIIEDFRKLKSAIIDSHFNGQNISCKIGDMIHEVSNRNKKNTDFPVLSVSNRQGFIAQTEQFENRVIASDDTSNYKIVVKDDFAYNPARINVGSIARLDSYENGIVSPMYICFRCTDEILPEYLELFFQSRYFQLEVEKRLEGSVRQCLSFDGIKSIQFSLIPISEQKEFTEKLNVIQSKLDNEKTMNNLYQAQRKYILANMFI